MPLFRQEVVAQQEAQWLGTVLLLPRASHNVVAVFALVAAAAVLALFWFAEYTRKARINGWLVPELGTVRVFAPQPGTLVQLHAREGMEVKQGAPLAVLSTEVQSEELGAIRREVIRRLASRRDSMAADRQRQALLFAQQLEDRRRRLEAVSQEQALIAQEFELQKARLSLAAQGAERQRQLFEGRLTRWDRLQDATEDKLRQAINLQTLERSRQALLRDRMLLEAELRELPLKHQIQMAEIDRAVSSLEQEIAEAEAKRQFVITAPQEGTVTAIQAEAGSTISSSVPMLTIVPKGVKLEAQLFGPSSAVGFVRPGQRVMLRYQAYPYQKFGQYEGTVASVSRSAISPSELSQQLSGLNSLVGTNVPVYRITVLLGSQTVRAYGEAVPLQPGMQLEADILMERRRLVEWVLDPLFTLTGRWRQ
ncbi:HlyD family secretion protein [Roseicella aquatilis]|nr:HlyD family efflux transporter periplasmic adaptor subunit [Roseicella aquatilis]